MKRTCLAVLLLVHATLAGAQPVLPAAGLDALYPAYLKVPGSANRLLIFGGEGADTKANRVIEELSFSRATAAASWTARGALAIARREPEVAVFPGTTVVAIVGGMGANGAALDSIETFDFATGSSTLLTAKLPSGVIHHQVVPCGTGPRVLIIGGEGANGEVASLTVVELDVAAPERSTVAPLRDASGRAVALRAARTFASAAAIVADQTRLLVAGGETARGVVLDAAELIDVTATCVARRIVATQSMHVRRTRGALARSVTAFAPPGRGEMQFEAIYYAGGDGNALALTSLVYDVETNAWYAGAALPAGYGRMRPPHAVDDTVIAIAGGDTGALRGPAVSANTWTLYFPENGGEWQPGSAPVTMHHARLGNAIAFLDGTLITVFGKDTGAALPFAGLDAPE